MKSLPFPDLIAALLRELRLDMPAGPPQEVYSLHFDGQPSLHLIGRFDAAHVDILTEATQLREPPEAEALMALLELNTLEPRTSAVTTIMLHRPSRTLIIGLRQAKETMDARALRQGVDTVRRRAEAVRKHCVKVPAQLSRKGSAPQCACCTSCSGRIAMATADPVILPKQSPASFALARQPRSPTHASGGEMDPSTPLAIMMRELDLAATLRVAVSDLADLIPEWEQGCFRMWRKHPGGLAELAFRSSTGEQVSVLAGEAGKALYDELNAYRRLCQQFGPAQPDVPPASGIPYSDD